jgi:hypothetical protein
MCVGYRVCRSPCRRHRAAVPTTRRPTGPPERRPDEWLALAPARWMVRRGACARDACTSSQTDVTAPMRRRPRSAGSGSLSAPRYPMSEERRLHCAVPPPARSAYASTVDEATVDLPQPHPSRRCADPPAEGRDRSVVLDHPGRRAHALATHGTRYPAQRPSGLARTRCPSARIALQHERPRSRRRAHRHEFARRAGPFRASPLGQSGTVLLPEVVVGGVWDLGHGACRCRVAFRGGGSEAAGGCDPLDVGRVPEPAGGR